MFRKLLRARKASIISLVAVSALAIIAMAAFSVDLGNAYSALSQNQRVADLAAYAGALGYNASGSTAGMTSAVSRIATLNGLAPTAITATYGTSPTGDGNPAVLATVNTTNPIYFASAVGAGTAVSINAKAYAELKAGTPGCITAIQPGGSGISVTGGTSVAAATCAIASNGTVPGQNTSVYTTCGTTITAKQVDYASNNPPVQSGCTTIKPPSGVGSVTMTHTTAVDKLAGNPIVTNAVSRLSSVQAITSPSGPSVTGGTAITFGWSGTPAMPAGCTATFSSPTWTVACPAAGTYTFGTISLGGGITLNFNTGQPAANRTFVFNGDINGSSGTAITFGSGDYTVRGGIVATGSMVMTWQGGGTFQVGTTTNCSGGAGYSLCTSGSGRIIIPGPSTFTLAGGIYQGASGMPPTPAMSLGSGSTANVYTIGRSSSGYSLNNANGSTLLGPSSTSGQPMSFAGGVLTSGGSCVQLPAAANHDINGSINGAGGIYLGGGVYTIAGFVSMGNGGGGDVGNCPSSGVTTGLNGIGVSLIIGGNATVSCGRLTAAFCLGAGYSTVSLVAPTSSSMLGANTAGLAVVGPTSSTNTAGAVFTSGATNTRISGVFYFPYGPINLSGAAALHDTVDSSACLEMVGSQISVNAGSMIGSVCKGLETTMGGTSSGIAIVQ